MIEWLSGKKTYITAGIVFFVAGLNGIHESVPLLKEIPDATWTRVLTFVQGGGIAAAFAFLRMGVDKK